MQSSRWKIVERHNIKELKFVRGTQSCIPEIRSATVEFDKRDDEASMVSPITSKKGIDKATRGKKMDTTRDQEINQARYQGIKQASQGKKNRNDEQDKKQPAKKMKIVKEKGQSKSIIKR